MTKWLPFHFSLSCIGEGNGNPLQCSCLENPRDGGAWWAAVYGVAPSQTRLKWLSSSSTLNKKLGFWCLNGLAKKVPCCAVLSHSYWLCPWGFSSKNTGVGCHALLQGIFPTQGSNPGSPALQVDSLPAELPGKRWKYHKNTLKKKRKRKLGLKDKNLEFLKTNKIRSATNPLILKFSLEVGIY